MLYKTILFFCFLTCFQLANSQNIIQGYVFDKQTSERLIGCNVYVLGTTDGVFSNNYGFFSIKTKQMPAILVFRFVGYEPDSIHFSSSVENLSVYLSPSATSLKGVEIKADVSIISKPIIGELKIPIQQIKSIPSLGGEVDVLKSFQLMPGVQGGSEGTSGLYVRGGTPDQNLVLLDDIPLYYVNHIGGFISVFDVNAINDVKLIKGGFPARYGGRLSSVIDIRMKSGNSESLKGEFGIGTLASRFFTEGPISKNKKTKFMFSLRRCNLDIFSRIVPKLTKNGEYDAGYTFYDLYSKITHDVDSKNSLSFSVYSGRDRVFFNQKEKKNAFENLYYNYKANLKWGNLFASLKWNHQYSESLFGSLTLATTNFDYFNGIKYEKKELQTNDIIEKSTISFNSGVRDYILKKDFDYYLSNNASFKFGISGVLHSFNPGVNIYQNNEKDSSFGSDQLKSGEVIAFTESELRFSEKVNASLGVHFNAYFVGKRCFQSLQPRATLNYIFTTNWAAKASYVYMQQNLHLLSNNTGGLPTDLWVPATSTTSPQYSHLYSVGLFHQINKLDIEISLEGYLKTLQNQIEFSDGQSFFGGANNWEDKIERNGKGNAYGIEFLIQKKQGRFLGWIGYTLSYNFRKFDNINDGNWFPYKFDRRHSISLFASYNVNKNFILSADFVFNTGNAVTLPDGTYQLANYQYQNNGYNPFNTTFNSVYTYPGRNQSRMPSFHKLDISARFIKELKNGTREWVVSVYNVYAHQNAYFIYFDHDKNKNLHLYQMCIFPIIPSVSFIRSF